MAIQIYNFNEFDGIAKTENQGNYELRIYLRGNCNCDVVILTKVENEYNIYNFICDKDHLKNMKDLDWFNPIKEIILYLDKIDNNTKQFINYALKNNVEVKITKKPF